MNSHSIWSIIPYPFFLPFFFHLLAVAAARLGIRSPRRGPGTPVLGRSFLWHAFISSCFAYALVVLFQSARMLWASDGWVGFSYLDIPTYGNAFLRILLGLTIILYLYAIVGTAKLSIVRRKNDRLKRCLHCNYTLENLADPCPECGNNPDKPARSKLRIRPFIFLVAAAFTFFSPFILANVFDLFV